MNRCAFVFPGQASQQVGMGRDLHEQFPEARPFFEQADATTGVSISTLCFEGPLDELTLTLNAQPALFTVSVACWHVLAACGVRPVFVAGHSLGEWSAAVAAGAIDFESALRLVTLRAQVMHEAPVGGMAAIIGLTRSQVEDLCDGVSEVGTVIAANLNAPDQIVISGDVVAIDCVMSEAMELGASRAIRLNVSGAFHSPLMRQAQEEVARAVEGVTFRMSETPIISNVSADATKDGETIKTMLVRQMTAPVCWEESVRFLLEHGVNTFVEVGPGRVLSGLIRRIERRAVCIGVDDKASLDKAIKVLSREGGTK